VRRLTRSAVLAHVAARLRERRTAAGLTQQGLADVLGVSCQQAHKYESGVNRIPVDRLWQVAQALEIDVSEFFPAPTELPKAPNGQRYRRSRVPRSRTELPIDRQPARA
jgi:transcriptional regulator with XRE-family HTH domain